MTRYTIKLHLDREQGGYWVTVPALPGCFSQGDTLEAAITNARKAIAGHISCLRELGEPVPAETDEGEPAQTLVIDVADELSAA
jgi:antitoxin HicB